MRTFFALAVALSLFCTATKADDKAKVAKEQVKRAAEKTEKGVKKGGNAFVRFWTDDVGKTIYRGLKKGSGKVADAFD